MIYSGNGLFVKWETVQPNAGVVLKLCPWHKASRSFAKKYLKDYFGESFHPLHLHASFMDVILKKEFSLHLDGHSCLKI